MHGLLGSALTPLSGRHKGGSMLDLADDQRRTWDRDCQYLEVSSCSLCWKTC